MVVALIALFVALGGTGYAATTLTNDGSATVAARRHRRSLRGPRGFRGRTGPQGPVGPQGPQGVQGVQGPAGTAKAYAEVSNTGRIIPGHALNITDANISHPNTGIYCFDLTALGISTSNAVVVASLDWSDPLVGAGDTIQVAANPASNQCTNTRTQVEVKGYDSTPALADIGFVVAFM